MAYPSHSLDKHYPMHAGIHSFSEMSIGLPSLLYSFAPKLLAFWLIPLVFPCSLKRSYFSCSSEQIYCSTCFDVASYDKTTIYLLFPYICSVSSSSFILPKYEPGNSFCVLIQSTRYSDNTSSDSFSTHYLEPSRALHFYRP